MPEHDKPRNVGAPFRDAPVDLRYICTVCYRSASATSGNCPRCGVPMLPLDDAEVVAMLRERVAARLRWKRAWISAAGILVGFGLSALICILLRLPFVDRGLKFGQYGSYLVSIGLPLTCIWWFATWRLFSAPLQNASVGELLCHLRIERV